MDIKSRAFFQGLSHFPISTASWTCSSLTNSSNRQRLAWNAIRETEQRILDLLSTSHKIKMSYLLVK